MNRNQFIVIGLGELLWDLLPEGPRLGGAPANFAYHATRLGNCGIVASRVGLDAYGAEAVGFSRSTDWTLLMCNTIDAPDRRGRSRAGRERSGVLSYRAACRVGFPRMVRYVARVGAASGRRVLGNVGATPTNSAGDNPTFPCGDEIESIMHLRHESAAIFLHRRRAR